MDGASKAAEGGQPGQQHECRPNLPAACHGGRMHQCAAKSGGCRPRLASFAARSSWHCSSFLKLWAKCQELISRDRTEIGRAGGAEGKQFWSVNQCSIDGVAVIWSECLFKSGLVRSRAPGFTLARHLPPPAARGRTPRRHQGRSGAASAGNGCWPQRGWRRCGGSRGSATPGQEGPAEHRVDQRAAGQESVGTSVEASMR